MQKKKCAKDKKLCTDDRNVGQLRCFFRSEEGDSGVAAED